VTERALWCWSGRVLTSAALATALSCSGAAFTSDSASCDEDCGGADGSSSGAAGSDDAGGGGQVSVGASAGVPSDAGETGAPPGGGGGGGVLNLGGGGLVAVGGIGGGLSRPFPVTHVLDDFNRADAALGEGWIGAADDYALKGEQLWCELCAASALWSGPFASEQEVFATYAGFDPDAKEMNLVLRAQGSTTCEQIELLYSPASLDVRVAYCVDGTWTDLESFELLLEAGQQLGGRIHADGTLQVFVDGALLGTVDASGYPHQVGRIGVSGVAGDTGLFWDDFGGGKWK
jgi:hypothetical protein